MSADPKRPLVAKLPVTDTAAIDAFLAAQAPPWLRDASHDDG